MKKILNGICVAAGFAAFGLGLVGIVLPVLPTTPFLILAAALFARGSERFHIWYRNTGLYKQYVVPAFTRKEMTVRRKCCVLGLVTALLCIGFFLSPVWYAKAVILVVLARIRHKVLHSLRRLAPAKLDGSEKGNLISIITSDIELLEVFYAHTISPVAIAAITSLAMCLYIGHFHWLPGVIAAVFYLLVGVGIPVLNSRLGQKYGREYRRLYGNLNTVVLDNLYGLGETLQYQCQSERLEKMNAYTEELERVNRVLKKQETVQRIAADSVILAAGAVMLLSGAALYGNGSLNAGEVLVCTVAMMSSFGPTAALSSLSNNLNQTLASGGRVLDLLEEKPVVEDIVSSVSVLEGDIQAERATFSYQTEEGKRSVLEDFSVTLEEKKINGILGKSGCGKSTLLKLLMRFYETDRGSILYGTKNVNDIDTKALRDTISYVTQDTFLFQDTIENNIKIADAEATREEVTETAKKASLHEFVMSLPQGYDTKLSELGESVSGGERQRIGIARAFLHKSRIILLDEPTSNIDSLNEGIILKSLDQEKQDKTIVLVSHRKSTMGIADCVTLLEERRE